MCDNDDVKLLTLTLYFCFFFWRQFVKQVTKTDDKVLEILTYVGLILSITGVIFTVITYLLLTWVSLVFY